MNKLLATTALIALTIAGAAHADTTAVITPAATPSATMAPATPSVEGTKTDVKQGITVKKSEATKNVMAKKDTTKGIVIAKKEDLKTKTNGKVDDVTSSVSNTATPASTK